MKKVGVPETPLSSALATSSLTRGRVLAAAQLVDEALRVEPELARVVGEVGGPQLALVGEQGVVHLPEAALGGGGLGGLGGELRVRVHVVERQVAPDVANVVAEARRAARGSPARPGRSRGTRSRRTRRA